MYVKSIDLSTVKVARVIFVLNLLFLNLSTQLDRVIMDCQGRKEGMEKSMLIEKV